MYVRYVYVWYLDPTTLHDPWRGIAVPAFNRRAEKEPGRIRIDLILDHPGYIVWLSVPTLYLFPRSGTTLFSWFSVILKFYM